MATAAEPKKPQPSLWTMLERRYADDQGWLLFYEVANRTGFASGYADALALSIWPSRGIELLGFEVKHSRSDLLTELKDENKAAKFSKFCHRWWLVVSDAKFTDGVEIPKTWGILAPRNSVLYQQRPAPELSPEPWTPAFIASMMRRFHESHIKKDADETKRIVEERAQALAKSREQPRKPQDDGKYKRELDELRQRVRDFETRSGLSVQPWQGEEVGEIVRLIQDGRADGRLKAQLTAARDAAKRIANSMTGALKNLEQVDASLSE